MRQIKRLSRLRRGRRFVLDRTLESGGGGALGDVGYATGRRTRPARTSSARSRPPSLCSSLAGFRPGPGRDLAGFRPARRAGFRPDLGRLCPLQGVPASKIGLVRHDERMTIGTLVLLRHGESEWNAKNLFTGWVDVDLSARGEDEARRGGELLRAKDLLPDVVHTSVLRRAIRTAELALHAADRHWIPVRRSWRLNERHYGALQAKNKKQTLEQFGEEQFMLWRRSYDVPPPPIGDHDEYSQFGDPRYAELGAEMPRTECLKDVVSRMLPYWEAEIVPELRSGGTVLLA